MADSVGHVFDSNASKYKCCCGGIDIKTGAQIVAIATLMQLALILLNVIVFPTSGYLIYDVVVLVVWGFAVICLAYAFRTERAVFCAPFIIAGIIAFIVGIVTVILATMVIFDSTSFPRDYVLKMVGESVEETDVDVTRAAVKLICWTIASEFIVQLYFVWIVYKYHIFLRDQKLLSQTNVTARFPNGVTTVAAIY